MYNWIYNKFGKNIANIFITIWYLAILFLVLISLDTYQARFKYGGW